MGSGHRDLPSQQPTFDVGAHRITLLKDGPEAFPAMLAAIAEAKKSVCLETYILRDDRTGQSFADALRERASTGVEVNLLYDDWGSSVSDGFIERLRAGGVRVLCFRPVRIFSGNVGSVAKLSRRDHRKMLVIDGRVVITGGINLSHDNASPYEGGSGWRDTNVRLDGPVAAEFQYFFLRTWRKEGGATLDEPRYQLEGRRPDPAVRIAASNLRGRGLSIREEYRNAILRAKHRIWITNCYFIPTPRLLRALAAAARRGVDVQIMVAGTTDVLAVRMASRALYGRLLSAGVRMFEWQGRVLHAKTAVIDGHWCTIGSSNLDHWSLQVSLEANVIIENRSFASAVEAMFTDDLTHCEEFTSVHWTRRSSWERAASWAAHMFREWL